MTDVTKAIAALRDAYTVACLNDWDVSREAVGEAIAALDAQPKAGEVWQYRAGSSSRGKDWIDCRDEERARAMEAHGFEIRCLYAAPPAQPVAVSADNVTPLRQPRLDLARLVESINAAVYDNAKGLSVTEAIGALELAKLELLKEQEQ